MLIVVAIGAMRALKEIFLLELLDSRTAQTLVLKTVAMFWEQKSLEASSVPEFDDAEAKRNVAGSLFVIGMHTTVLYLIEKQFLFSDFRQDVCKTIAKLTHCFR